MRKVTGQEGCHSMENFPFKKDGPFVRDMSIFLLFFFGGGVIDMIWLIFGIWKGFLHFKIPHI